MISVVEDNASNQLLVREILEPAGYRIEVSSTSTQGLELLENMTPAAILMDMKLYAGFITKPIDVDTLPTSVSEFLARERSPESDE